MDRQLTSANDADLDIARLFGAIWRSKVTILAVSLLITGIAFAVLSTMAPQYRADARVLIQTGESIFTRPTENGNDGSRLDREGVTSQVDVLMSTELLKTVAERVRLADYDEFDPDAQLGAIKLFLAAFGLIPDPRAQPAEERVLEAFRENLGIYARENSRVIVIEFTSEDQELTAQVPNVLAEEYLKLESRASLESTGDAASFLSAEIAKLQDSVREAESRVAQFRSANGLLNGQNREILATQQLSELSTELSRVRADRAEAQARARSVQRALDNGTDINTLPDVIDSPIIGRLREQEIRLNSQLADLRTTLLDNHPQVRALRSQLADLNAQIRNEARKVLISLRTEAEIAGEREQQLIAEVNGLKAVSSDANTNQVQLNALEREANTQRALLESYLIRFREAQTREDTGYAPALARLISRAVMPTEPVFPKMLPMLIAIFVVSMLVSSLIVLLRELFSGRAFVPAAGAGVGSAGAAGQPAMETAVTGRVNDAALDGLAATAVADGTSRMLFVSPEGNNGATASVTMARSLAALGLSTVLVDLTTTGLASALMTGDPDLAGMTDLLAGYTGFGDIIHGDFKSAADIVPSGGAPQAEARKGLGRLPMIVNSLQDAYDVVVMECGDTTPDAIAGLVRPGTRIVMAVASAHSSHVEKAADAFLRSGLGDLTLVVAPAADGLGAKPAGPGHWRSAG